MGQIGIKIVEDKYSSEIYEEKLMNHDYEIAYAGWHVKPQSDIFPFFISIQAVPGGKNLSNYVNAKVDSLLYLVRQTNDFSLKVEITKHLHEILHEDAPYVFLWKLRHHAAYRRELKDVSIDPYNFFSTIEDWFFDY